MKRHFYRTSLLTYLSLAMLHLPPPASASDGSLIGPKPYTFPARSAQSALVLYENKRNGSVSGQGSGSTRVYNNTTISATNWQQIEMTLGDDAEAALNVDSSQNADGSTANANSEFFNRQEATQALE